MPLSALATGAQESRFQRQRRIAPPARKNGRLGSYARRQAMRLPATGVLRTIRSDAPRSNFAEWQGVKMKRTPPDQEAINNI